MYIHFKTFLKVIWFMAFRRFSIRRFLFLIAFLFFYGLIFLILTLFRFLDNIFFYKFKRQEIKKPVFIIGNPRGGTTFLADLIGQDTENFAQPKLYQTLFCSIIFYKIIKLFSRNKKKKANKGKINRFDRFFSRFKGIHEIRLNKFEEDEALFFLAFLSQTTLLICPFADKFPNNIIVDNMPEKTKKRFMKHYKNSIKRYLYVYGENRTYFCKNVSSTGKIKFMRECFPDATIIHPVRTPYKTIPSMISFYHQAWKMHSPKFIGKSKETLNLAHSFIDLYKNVLKNKDKLGKNFILVKFQDLIKNPLKKVDEIYKKLRLKQPKGFRKKLRDFINNRKYISTHKYSLEEYGLTKEFIYKELKEVFNFYDFEK